MEQKKITRSKKPSDNEFKVIEAMRAGYRATFNNAVEGNIQPTDKIVTNVEEDVQELAKEFEKILVDMIIGFGQINEKAHRITRKINGAVAKEQRSARKSLEYLRNVMRIGAVSGQGHSPQMEDILEKVLDRAYKKASEGVETKGQEVAENLAVKVDLKRVTDNLEVRRELSRVRSDLGNLIIK